MAKELLYLGYLVSSSISAGADVDIIVVVAIAAALPYNADDSLVVGPPTPPAEEALGWYTWLPLPLTPCKLVLPPDSVATALEEAEEKLFGATVYFEVMGS